MQAPVNVERHTALKYAKKCNLGEAALVYVYLYLLGIHHTKAKINIFRIFFRMERPQKMLILACIGSHIIIGFITRFYLF